MHKYSNSHRNRAFLLSIFIYVTLVFLVLFFTIEKKTNNSYNSEKIVLLKLREMKPVKKVKKTKKIKKVEKRLVAQKPKPKVTKKVVVVRKEKVKEVIKEVVAKVEKPALEVVEEEIVEEEPVIEVAQEEVVKEEIAEKEIVKKQVAQEQIVQNYSVGEGLIQSIERALRRHIYYPKAARRMGLEAGVELKFKFLPSGEVKDVKVSGNAAPILLKAARKTLMRASRDFEKVKKTVTIQVPLKFVLES